MSLVEYIYSKDDDGYVYVYRVIYTRLYMRRSDDFPDVI